MKKLSRKNKLGIQKSSSEEQRRYSFRKLSSGLLVSAAIGAFLFFDNNTVQAATNTSSDSANQVTQEKTDTSDITVARQKLQQKTVQITTPVAPKTNAPVISEKDNKQTDISEVESTKSVVNKQSASADPATDDQVTSSKKQPETKVATPKSTVSASQTSAQTKAVTPATKLATTNLAATPSNTPKATLSTGTSITINQSTIGAIKDSGDLSDSGDLVITLTVPNYQVGTKVTLVVPNGYYYGPDTSQNLPAGTGTTTISPSATNAPGPWTIINTYTSASNGGGSTTQSFVFRRYNNYNAQEIPMNQIGLVDKTVTLTQTDPGQKPESIPLTFQQYTNPQMDPSMKLSRPMGTSMTTPLIPNTTYVYEVDINETTGVDYGLSYASNLVNNAVNSGTTITIPVPQGFLLNQSLTKQLNNFTDQTTISQSGGAGSDIIITVPKGSGSQYNGSPGYQLAGQYNLPTPQTDTTYTAKGSITVDQQVQYADGTMHKLTGTIAPWSVVIQGDTATPNDVPALGINGVGYSNQATGTLPTNANPKQPLLTFDIDNPSTLNVTNGQVTFDIPNGLEITKVTTPVSATNLPGTTSYQWKATLTNGQTASGTANAGDAITTDSAIKTLVINPNLLEPGATTIGNSFKFYGTVDKSLANGTNLKATGQTQYAVDGKTYYKTVEVNQTISQATAGEGAWFSQSSTQPGTKAGFMSVYSTYGNPNSNQIYEPIFYYVIPNGFSYDMAKGVTSVNGGKVQPKVSTFEVNSQEVVKLDYTGTGYNFITGGNANNWIYLNISPLAVPGTNYRAAIYVVSPTTKMTNQVATTDPNFNPAFTQGQTKDTYLVGSNNFTVSTAQVVSVPSVAQGNLNTVAEIKGSSDDKGKPNMSFQTRVENASKNPLNDGTLVINVDQGGTSFQLTGAVAGLPTDAMVTYSTAAQKAPGSTTGAQPDLTSYVSADQVTDWSKIQSVAIHFGTIAANTYSPIITLNGTDPTLAQDAGKTVAIVTQMYTTNLAPLVGKTTDNAHITVSGKSTVTSQYSYVDDQGKTQIITIPGLNYTYNDNKDTALTEAQAMSNLTADDKKSIPAGYVIGSVQLLAPAAKSWQTDAPIGTPEFGKTAQYFYNNAIVQYNLVKVYSTDAQTKDVTRTIDYIDQTTSQAIPSSLAKTVTQTATVTQYEVKDSSGKLLGYNTTGTWANGVYTPSKDANGQIKVDTTDANVSWMANGSKWDQISNPNLGSHGYNGPFTSDGKTANLTVAENTKPTADETVKVYYTENIVNVSTPVTTTDTVPGTDTHFAQNISATDLSKTITRTINVYDQTGKLVPSLSRSQTVTFTRSAKVNAVTGAINGYTDWTSTNSNFDAYNPTVTADQGIQTITADQGANYTNVTKDTNGKLAGVGEVAVPNTDTSANDEIVNIYLNQAKTFTGTETITYNTYDKDGKLVGTPTTETHNATVLGTEYYNPATGKVEYTFDKPTATYQSVNVAPKTGYYASTNTIPEVSKTINSADPQDSDLNTTATVDYKPMGQVIQVDQNGKQIPGTTPVTYNNEPNNPTKAGETTVPNAPTGWVIVDPSKGQPFTPTDPGQDTKVAYEPLNTVAPNTETVTRTINYVDQTTGQPMPSSVVKTVTQNVTLTQYEVKDSTGKVIGYNTTGTWTNGVYSPSKEANGQIKVDTTKAGDSWMNSDGSKWDQVTNPDLTKLGYVGPRTSTISEVTPTTSTTNTTETIYYTEKTVTVTPDKPKTTSDTIDGTDVKYPTGVSENDLNKTVTRTVTIVNPDGTKTPTTQTFKFTRSATVNAVTGKVTYGAWNEANHNFDSVTVPTIPGYTPSGDVPAISVTPDSKDSAVTITYTANDQKTKIEYVTSDGQPATNPDGTKIPDVPVNGKTDEKVSVTDKINNGIPTGWELVPGQDLPGDITFGPNGADPIPVKIQHKTTTVNYDDPKTPQTPLPDNPNVNYPSDVNSDNLNKTVTRVVTITDPSGKVATTTQTVKFGRSATVDEVTGKVTAYGDWQVVNNTSANLNNVSVPAIDGYTPEYTTGTDQSGLTAGSKITTGQVDPLTINPADYNDATNTITVNVGYTANEQSATITYIDDTTGETITNESASGKFGQPISFTTSPTDEIKTLVGEGYELVSNNFTGQNYQADNENNNFEVHLKEKAVTVTPDSPKTTGDTIDGTNVKYPIGVGENDLNKTVTRTVTIVNPDGTTTPTTQTFKFTRSATVNAVTGKVTYGDWNEANHNFDSVTVPTIPGYTPSGDVPALTVTPDSKNSEVTITYTANDQKTKIEYVTSDGQPATNPDGTKVPDVPVNGKTDEKVSVTDKINSGIPTGWELVPGQDLPGDITFGPNGADPIPVKIQHKTESETPETKTVTRTINVTDPVTSKVTTTTQTANFTRTVTKDLVTGDLSYGKWNTDQKWDSFTTPTIDGYTPSEANVAETPVTADDTDQTVDIIYTANKQSTTIKYVDDDEQGKQVGNTVTLNGKTGETVDTNIKVPENYELAPNQKDLPKQITFSANGYPEIIVHLIHKTTQVTQTQEITQTIHYVMSDGSKAPADNVQTITVTRTGTKDLVTGQITWNSVTSQAFNDITSPAITGYTPDQAVVKGASVSYGDKNIEITVTYTKNVVPSAPSQNGGHSETGTGNTANTSDNEKTPTKHPTAPTHQASPIISKKKRLPKISSKFVSPRAAMLNGQHGRHANANASANKQFGNSTSTSVTKQKTLPQTGDNHESWLNILGLGSVLASIVSGMWISKKKKK